MTSVESRIHRRNKTAFVRVTVVVVIQSPRTTDRMKGWDPDRPGELVSFEPKDDSPPTLVSASSPRTSSPRTSSPRTIDRKERFPIGVVILVSC